MFALFFSLYASMFTGSWHNYYLPEIGTLIKAPLNDIGTFLTSIFGDNQMTTLGNSLMSAESGYPTNIILIVCLILALITSIGIGVMAVKGIKRIFSVFFYGVR